MEIPKYGDVRGSYSFTITSRLRSPAARVWAHASTFAGVNRELWPLARMTFPPALGRLAPEAIPLGRAAFRSWVLLGRVPVEYDDFTLLELAPGRGFHESSPLLTMREWRHRRTVTPAGEGCVVRNEVTFVPGGGMRARSWPACTGVGGVFAWRHSSIRRRGGSVEDVVVIELVVPRAWLRRNRRQLWYSVRDIPPARFTRVIDFAEVAGASVDLVA